MGNPLATLPTAAEDGLYHVVIDTPAGSRNKFKYDEEAQCFCLSRVLPVGAVFPWDFGSLPLTLAEDGDPLDVLVIGEAPTFCGCLLTVKLIGGIAGRQTDKGKTIRNDRLIGVPVTKTNPAAYAHIRELPGDWLDQIEHFFVSYNQAEGRRYEPTRRLGPKQARALVADAGRRYERDE